VSRTLQDAGFKLGNVSVAAPASSVAVDTANQAAASVPPAEPSPASIIVTQAPGAGQKVLAGATVNFEVR